MQRHEAFFLFERVGAVPASAMERREAPARRRRRSTRDPGTRRCADVGGERIPTLRRHV